MLEVKFHAQEQKKENTHLPSPPSAHASFHDVYARLLNWISRFPYHEDYSLIDSLHLFYLLAGKKYLDHRNPAHISRLILAIHFMQKRLLQSSTSSNFRQLEVKCIPTTLLFPFSSKSVLGCLVGFNLMDRYELFDEENVLLVLQKHFPQFRLVQESDYSHTSSNKNLKMFYFEIEKNDGSLFCLQEQIFLKQELVQRLKTSIQRLSPTIFMRRNEEEVYKNILVLSQQIHSIEDLPQALITLDEQTKDEIIFLVTMVYISPTPGFSLHKHFIDGSFVSERLLTVKYLQNHPIEAHIFHIHLGRDASLLRSDGSLDFYSARQKAAERIFNAIGEFRDYNGGIILKQQELLQCLKEKYSQTTSHNPELIETFFYAITPLEKQVLLQPDTLSLLFSHFLSNYEEKSPETYSLKIFRERELAIFALHASNASVKEVLNSLLQSNPFKGYDITYNIIEINERIYFQCALFSVHDEEMDLLIQTLQKSLITWEKQIKDRQILRIAFEYSLLSLDPRIGGESLSQVVSGMLFEGLTRFDANGDIKKGIAEQIQISPDLKKYTFYLRSCLWSDGSPLSAYDFEYAWKKVLTPSFKTAFAFLFYPIKGAQEAKEGRESMERIGIKALDEQTLAVELNHPAPYFLELTSLSIYSPIHRLIDQRHPQWPYQAGKHYPCNGAFSLEANNPGQNYKLKKNPLYWAADNVALDEIIFNQMTPYQALQAFRKKEIDWLGHPLGGWHSFYTPEKNDRIISFPNVSIGWHIFNTSLEPFCHKKLRQAIAFVIQRSDFLTAASLPLSPAYSPLLPHQHGHLAANYFPQQEIETARRLWEEGWQELGYQKTNIPRLNLIFHHKGAREHVAHHLQRQLKEFLGVDCDLRALPWNVIFEKMCQGDFQMGLMQWSPWVDDPIYTLNAFRSAQEKTNFSKWENPDFQELLNLSDQETNRINRFSYFAKAEKILCQEMPIIPLFYQPYQALIKNNLNISYNVSRATFNFAHCFIKKETFYDSNLK